MLRTDTHHISKVKKNISPCVLVCVLKGEVYDAKVYDCLIFLCLCIHDMLDLVPLKYSLLIIIT